MPTAPKHVNWSATTEGDSWVYAFRFVTPNDREDTIRRAETIANWEGKKRDDPEVVQAAYAAIREAIERRVDELDGPATEGSLALDDSGEPTGLGDAADVETVDALKTQLAEQHAAVVALVTTAENLAVRNSQLAEEINALVESAKAQAGLVQEDADGE